jgi:type IV secretion system protein TrbI
MQDNQHMSPDASPNAVSKRAGVRRVNNMPVYIVGGLMGVFLLVMVLVASDRAAKQNKPPQAQEEKAVNTTMFAKELAGDRKDGIIEPQAALPLTPPSDLNAGPLLPEFASGAGAITKSNGNLNAPPIPPTPPNFAQEQALQSSPRNDELNRIRLAKLQQLEEAIKAKSSVSATPPRSAGAPGHSSAPLTRDDPLARLASVRQQIDANTRDDPTAAYKAKLAQIQGSGAIPAGSGGTAGAAHQFMPTTTTPNSVAQFGNAGQGDRWKLDAQPEAPRSPYELRAGFVVPATLISGINSELPGQIMGQVAQNVYDTATGKYLLIPQGSRLVGQYASSVAYGQSRVLVAWQRIVFPDGKAMDIGAMPGTDSAGYAGLSDQVNNHYLRMFASAILMSGVTAGISLSQPQQSAGATQNARSALSEALGQQLGQVTAQLIAKNMSVAPTLEIRPGYRFNVMVTKDMTFSKPYQSFDY